MAKRRTAAPSRRTVFAVVWERVLSFGPIRHPNLSFAEMVTEQRRRLNPHITKDKARRNYCFKIYRENKNPSSFIQQRIPERFKLLKVFKDDVLIAAP